MDTVRQTRYLAKLTAKQALEDLQEFQNKALELGSSAAKIIPASDVLGQERMWLNAQRRFE